MEPMVSTEKIGVPTSHSQAGLVLTPAHQILLSKIMSWDITRVKKYLVNRGKVASHLVDELETEYKRFIFLNIAYRGEIIPIAGAVDELWHAHILFTRDYSAFCNTVNGEYIHHNPTVDDEEKEALGSAYSDNTLTLYKKTFGELNENVWRPGLPVCTCHNNENCTSD